MRLGQGGFLDCQQLMDSHRAGHMALTLAGEVIMMKFKQFFVDMLVGGALVVAIQTISMPSIKFTVVAEAVDKAMVESISKGSPVIVAVKVP